MKTNYLNHISGILLCVLLSISFNSYAQPANDLCSNAIAIACNSTTIGTTTASTVDNVGTCTTSNTAPGVWYSFTGTGDVVTLSTCNVATNYDTKISVFSGSCGGLVCVGGNDDGAGCINFQSLFTFNSVAGTNYLILVHGFGSATGDFTLSLTCVAPPPPLTNDLCANAIPITCNSTITGTTVGSTTDNAGTCGTTNTAPGVWYSLLGNGKIVEVNTCSGTAYDSKISVFSGSCGSLVCVDGNDDACGLQSSVTFSSVPGTTYYILVHGFSSATGAFTLSTVCLDYVVAAPYTSPVRNTCGAGDDCGPYSSADHVYEVTIPFAGDWGFSLCGSDPGFDTFLSVGTTYCGIEIGFNDDAFSCSSSILHSELTAIGLPAGTYYVTVQGWALECGDYILTISPPPPTIANDFCGDAIPVACNSSTTGTTVGSTFDNVGTCGTSNTAPGVWYSIVGNGDFFEISTCDVATNYDTKLSVFSGTCGNLVCVTGIDDDFSCVNSALQSTVSFQSVVGTTYYILVHGFSSGTGDFTLNVNCIDCSTVNAGTATGPATSFIGDVITYQVSGSSPAGGTYQWEFASDPNGPWTTIGGATTNPVDLIGNVAGTYYIRAIYSSGGCEVPTNAVTTVVSTPPPPVNDNICDAIPLSLGTNGPYSNVTATVEVGEPTPGAGSGGSSCDSQDGWCSFETAVQNSMWFTLVAPPSGSVSVEVIGFDSQLAVYSASSCSDVLNGNYTEVAANDDGSPNWLFGSLISPLNCIGLTPGEMYFVQVDGFGGSVSGNIQVIVTEIFTGLAVSGSSDCDGNITLTPSGGTGQGYEWSSDGTNFNPLGDVYTINLVGPSVNDLSGFGYGDELSWTLTDASNNIIASGGGYALGGGGFNVSVSVSSANSPLTFNISTVGFFNDNSADYEIYCGSTLLVSGYILGGSTATETGIACPAGGATTTQPLSTTQTYYVRDDRGCVVASVDVTTPDPVPTPVISASTAMPACNLPVILSTQLTTAGGYSFDWGGGQPGETFETFSAGTYTVVATNIDGCDSDPASFDVSIISLQAGALSSPVSCNGGSDGEIQVIVVQASVTNADGSSTPMTGTNEFSLDGGAFSSVNPITGLMAGDYYVTIRNTDYPGCVKSALPSPATVSEPPVLTTTITGSSSPTCFGGNDGSASASASGGVGGYTFEWLDETQTKVDDGPNTGVLSAGTYTVVVTDANGCTATATVTINNPPQIIVDIGSPQIFVPWGTANGYTASGCHTFNPQITNGTGPFDYQWSTGATVASITECKSADGIFSYTLTVTDADGCTGTATVQLIWSNIDCSNNTNGTKIKICHVPPGNPSNCQTVCISVNAAPALLANGSYIGNCQTPCPTARVSNPGVSGQIHVLPNPTTGKILVNYMNENVSASTIEIRDLQGRLVFDLNIETATNFTEEIDLSSLDNGLYFLNVIGRDGVISTSRVVKAE